MFGDAKTIENVTKFVRDMQEQRISHDSKHTVRGLPQGSYRCSGGPWILAYEPQHAHINIQYILPWLFGRVAGSASLRNISKDVRSCYFQASWLVTFVHDELCQFFIHKFVSDRGRHEDEIDMSPSDFITHVAIEFSVFIKDMQDSDDKWLATCSNLLAMTSDFIAFVTATRVGDSISIEYNYQKQSDVWEALNQNKYVEIFCTQQERLCRDFPFSRLMDFCINCIVRRYHESTGKRCVAQDEFVEHTDKF